MLRYTRKANGEAVVWLMTPGGWKDISPKKEKCIACVAETDNFEIRNLFRECPFCGTKVY